MIHRLTHRRHNHGKLHVPGYTEKGATAGPFDMTVLNDLDRYHLAIEVVDRVAILAPIRSMFHLWGQKTLAEHRRYICERGDDLPEIRNGGGVAPAS